MPDSENNSPDLDLVAHPHDAFFKTVFSDPVHASAFFREHLPQRISERLNWKSLSVQKSSFVKSSLQQTHADLLFRVQMGERDLLLYLLFEHQSGIDPSMPLRLLSYLTEILLEHQRQQGLPLPPVIGFVLHQGPERWNVSPCFEDLFELPEQLANDLAPFLPKFRHALLDLTQWEPGTEDSDSRLSALLQLMKLARENQLQRLFEWWRNEVRRLADILPESLLKQSLLYAFHLEGDLDTQAILHILKTDPNSEKLAMSIAEQLIAEGKIEGKIEGVWIGKVEILEELMKLEKTPRDQLARFTLPELERRFRELHRQYEARFKAI